MNRYRLIHYMPDFVMGARFPIAAAVAVGDRLHVVEMERMPGPDCLGSNRRAATLQLILNSLRYMQSIDRLPPGVGPHAIMDDIRAMPDQIEDAVEWVQANIMALHAPKKEPTGRHNARSRAQHGQRFFHRWNVDEYVREKFQPGISIPDWLPDIVDTLNPATHWVGGRSELLLMEPIVPTHKSFEKDVTNVSQEFWAYGAALKEQHGDDRKKVKLVSYVLRGGTEEARAYALNVLRRTSDEVIDASSDAYSQRFTDDIKRLGRLTRFQGEMG